MIKRWISQKYKIIGFISYITINALLNYQSYGQSSLGLEFQIEKTNSLNGLSRNFAFVNNVSALQLANQALEQSLLANYTKGQAFAFNNISSVFSEQFLFDESVYFIKKALNIFQDLNDQEGIANCNISLGHIFNSHGQDSVAYFFHQKAFNFFQTIGNTERMAITSHNLSQVLLTLNDRYNAKDYFLKALKYAQKLKKHQLYSACLSYIGQIEFKKKSDEKIRRSEINSKVVEANSNVIKILIAISICLTGLLIVIAYQLFIHKRNQEIIVRSNEIAKIGTWEMFFSKFLNKELPILSSILLEILELDKVTSEQLKIISWTNFFKSEESENRLIEVVQESISANQPFDIELQLLTHKRNEIWIRLIGNVENVSQNDFRLYGIAQDITEIKNEIKLIEGEMNKVLELSKLKSKFVSIASHEFRTPLATITTSMELIKINLDRILVPPMEVFDRHINGVLNQIDRLEDTLESILMLEQTIQGKIKIAITQVDLSKLLLDLVESVPIIGDPRIPALSLDKAQILLNSDPYILNHILQNIISNALKYSKGKQEPIIKAYEFDKNIVIEVQDFGIGIPESDKFQLFTPFFRAKNTAGIKGTGLGLSIVKEFVSLINADISIESEEGEGTKVILTFPNPC